MLTTGLAPVDDTARACTATSWPATTPAGRSTSTHVPAATPAGHTRLNAALPFAGAAAPNDTNSSVCALTPGDRLTFTLVVDVTGDAVSMVGSGYSAVRMRG